MSEEPSLETVRDEEVRKQNLESFDKLQEKKRRYTTKQLRARQLAGDSTLTARELRRIEKWKWSPEGILSSAREHLGNIINNTTGSGIRDLTEAIIYGALAYQAYEVLDGKDNGPTTALYGPIALKLATTPGGVGSFAQATGIGMLALLGLVSIPGVSDTLHQWGLDQGGALSGQPLPFINWKGINQLTGAVRGINAAAVGKVQGLPLVNTDALSAIQNAITAFLNGVSSTVGNL